MDDWDAVSEIAAARAVTPSCSASWGPSAEVVMDAGRRFHEMPSTVSETSRSPGRRRSVSVESQ